MDEWKGCRSMSCLVIRSPRRCRRWRAAVFAGLLGFSLCAAVPLAVAVDGPPAATAADESPADKATMAELRKTIEAIPEDRREVDGAAILEAWLPKFNSDRVRQRVLLSLGGFAQMQGRTTASIAFWQRAADLNADPMVTIRAREYIADSISASGDLKAALNQLSRIPEPTQQLADAANLAPEVTDDIYNTEVKRIELLIDHGRREEAFPRIIRLAKLYPNHRISPLVLAEGLTAGFFLTKDHESCVRWRRRIAEAIPYAAESDMFLGNAIAEKISVGLKEEAAAMILDYNQRFPNDSSTASHYDFLAGYEQDKGNLDAACAYYRQAIATGKAMSESTEVFEINLAQLEGRPRPPSRTPIEKAPSDQDPRFWLLVANGTLVVVLLTWYVWRRWAHSQATH